MRPIILSLALLLTGAVFGATTTPHQQVVLRYVNRITVSGEDVDVLYVPKEEMAVIGVIPLDKQAVLSPDSYLLCESSIFEVGITRKDGQDVGPRDEILWTCGGKRYLFRYLQIMEKK